MVAGYDERTGCFGVLFQILIGDIHDSEKFQRSDKCSEGFAERSLPEFVMFDFFEK